MASERGNQKIPQEISINKNSLLSRMGFHLNTSGDFPSVCVKVSDNSKQSAMSKTVMAKKENLLLLFEHPQEPVFVEKGPKKAVFDVPSKFLTDRFRTIGTEVQTKFIEEAEERIPVRDDIPIPDLSVPLSLGRHEQFSLFIPRHRRLAATLIDIFMKLKTLDELQTVAVYARDRLNPFLFNYALSVVSLHREDTKNLNIPLFIESFPEKFLDASIFARIREEAFLVPDGLRRPIEIPKSYTASDDEIEHKLWYFREDVGINLHHWHWRLVYPYDAFSTLLVAKHRRGELFYYMHEQIMARYNTERLSNRMERVKPFASMRETISEAYFPKMSSQITSRAWPARSANVQLTDLNRGLDEIKITISDMETFIDRFKLACEEGYAKDPNGDKVHLDDYNGIDMLGNMMESTIVSIDRDYYGDIHNMGHVFMAFAHDPEHRHLESFGVLGESATAIRDPAFYKWHAFIDQFFQIHKEKLPPYTKQEIGYESINISSVEVKTNGGVAPNVFNTFWQQSDIDLSRGMDFIPRGNIYARFTHLQHTPFEYFITVNNEKSTQVRGTMRIFMAPKFDEEGKEFKFDELRLLMMEMDRFTVNMHPGENVIKRKSTESAVTLPYSQTFRNIDKERPEQQTGAGGQVQEVSPESYAYDFCGCGWPQHMLVPRGAPESDNGGFACQLFAMVSNYDDDVVEQDLTGSCANAVAYCGIRDRLYPDKRNMGFPFDRKATKNDGSIHEFLLPNMKVIDCKVIFKDVTVEKANPNFKKTSGEKNNELA